MLEPKPQAGGDDQSSLSLPTPKTKPSSKLKHLPRVVLSRIGCPNHVLTDSPIDTAEDVSGFWRRVIAADPSFEPDKEHFIALLVDTKLRCKGYNVVSVGVVNETLAAPRETFRAAIVAAAYGVILAHNHPSGDPSPSQADHRLTRRMRDAAQLLEIQLLDHVIVGKASHFSFREAGVL